MARKTFRKRVYAVATPGGEFRLFTNKGKALALAKEWKKVGLRVEMWRGKPTWRRIA